MIEYVTMEQIEKVIEDYYKEHHIVLSFYAALTYLKQQGMTSVQPPTAPDFSKWDLHDLDGLLAMFHRIPIPLVVEKNGIAKEQEQRSFYDSAAMIFKQPKRMQSLDHPEHARQPKDSVRIIYVLKGSCHITLDKWHDQLDAESVVLLSSDMNLYLESGDKDIVLNVFIDRVHFTKAFFSGMYLDDVMMQFFERAIYKAANGIIHFKILHPDHIHSIFQRLIIEMCHQDNHSDSIIQGYIRLLCMELNRASLIYSDRILDTQPESANRLVHVFPALLQYIRNHYDTISLDSLSARFHYDSAYLSRMIKQLTGMNFTAILTQTRLEAAEQLLRSSDKKVERIAKEVGYNSYDHFARLFKSKNGITPCEYRQQHLEQ